jgi:hypothetical protein
LSYSKRIKEFIFFFASNLALSSNKERARKAKADTGWRLPDITPKKLSV